MWNEAKANLERARQLQIDRTITRAEFDAIVAAERVAEARYAAAVNSVLEKIATIGVRQAELSLARQRLEYAVIRAPFDGLVQQRHVAPGAYVQIGGSLVTLVRSGDTVVAARQVYGDTGDLLARDLPALGVTVVRVDAFDVDAWRTAISEHRPTVVYGETLSNPQLRVRGVIATMYDRRTRLAQQVVDDVPGRYGLDVLQPPVPKSVKVAEAPSHGCTILRHASSSKGAQAYREIAAQLVPQPA